MKKMDDSIRGKSRKNSAFWEKTIRLAAHSRDRKFSVLKNQTLPRPDDPEKEIHGSRPSRPAKGSKKDEGREQDDKPGSVDAIPKIGSRGMVIYLDDRLPGHSSGLPGSERRTGPVRTP